MVAMVASDACALCLCVCPVRSRSLLDMPTDEYGYVKEELWPPAADEDTGETTPPGDYHTHTHFTENDNTASPDTDPVTPFHVEEL